MAEGDSGSADVIGKRFASVRSITEEICRPLVEDDFMVQSTPDTSPVKWHLAHTTWFFEKFILERYAKNYEKFQKDFDILFNSYYETIGKYLPKTLRGVISRPTLADIMQYRSHVTHRMLNLMDDCEGEDDVLPLLELGINHEQQHQELILMDIKMNFFTNPLRPSYHHKAVMENSGRPMGWKQVSGREYYIGFSGNGFSFDNERPKHRVIVQDYEIADRLVTNGEFLEFMDDGGYQKPELWLSDGWDYIGKNSVESPLYWIREGGEWREFTLSGTIDLKDNLPVSHVSYYEADAFARWYGKRLPTEFEWEIASTLSAEPSVSQFMESGIYHPSTGSRERFSIFGSLWNWTGSAYLPYPGFHPLTGSVGEYNGKFMSGQMVLRGGSCVTPLDHIRRTYRNFYPPDRRWQFSGIRMAGDSGGG